MPYKIYYQYRSMNPVYYGTFEFENEQEATNYAFKIAKHALKSYEKEINTDKYEDFYSYMFDVMDFWAVKVDDE